MWRARALKVLLVVVGLLFTATVYPAIMSVLQEKQAHYAPMMLSLYVTLGIFLLLAVRNPAENRSVIAFTAWSSFAHAAVMTAQAVPDVSDRAHLLGGSAGLVLIGVAFIALAPAKGAAQRAAKMGA